MLISIVFSRNIYIVKAQTQTGTHHSKACGRIHHSCFSKDFSESTSNHRNSKHEMVYDAILIIIMRYVGSLSYHNQSSWSFLLLLMVDQWNCLVPSNNLVRSLLHWKIGDKNV